MIISIASGKGGTGKTTVATNLALSVEEDVQLLDCDVEEPNAHIFIQPQFFNQTSVVVAIPQVDNKKCTFCNRCASVCAFNAIAVIPGKILVFPELCHSCGACQYFCPVQAINEIDKEIGIIKFGIKNKIDFIHGQLNIGEVIPTPVIKEVKKYIDRSKIVIIDAPPGTSCPVIEAVKGSDFCILVTEPTPFGLNDLILALEVLQKMRIPFGVIINRSDLGNKETEEYCHQRNVPILMTIPFEKTIAVAYSKGIPLVEIVPKYKKQFGDLLKNIHEII